MQPTTEPPVQVTVLEGDRPVGSGVLVEPPTIVLADEDLSRRLYARKDLFPSPEDEEKVLDGPGEREPAAPTFVVELVQGEKRERIEVREVDRSLEHPPWVALVLKDRSALPAGPLPDEAMKSIGNPAAGAQGSVALAAGQAAGRQVNPVCLVVPKACR